MRRLRYTMSSPADSVERAERTEARPLGFWMCTALVVGNTIGMGIFLMPAALAPYGLNAVTGWLVTVIGCVFLACVFAGLARSFPKDDGPYAYTRRAFGDGAAFILLWCYWVSTCVSIAALAIGIVSYLSILVPALSVHSWLPATIALLLVWLAIWINSCGVRAVGWMQMLTTVLKLTPLLAVVALGLWVLLTPSEFHAVHPPANAASLKEVIAASTIALFAMIGIESAVIPAGKVRDPAHTIPRATVTGTLIAGLLYLCVSVVPMLLVPQGELASSNAPFADLFARYLGRGYGELLATFVVISGLGALNGWTLVIGEVTRSLARHGSLPATLGRLNSRGSPALALVLTGILASLMLLVNYNESMTRGFTFLSIVVTAANLPLYVGCSLAVVVMWRRKQVEKIGRREALWFGAAVIAIGYCIWVFIGIGTESLLWALALGVLGAPLYLWSVFTRRRTVALPKEVACTDLNARTN